MSKKPADNKEKLPENLRCSRCMSFVIRGQRRSANILTHVGRSHGKLKKWIGLCPNHGPQEAYDPKILVKIYHALRRMLNIR